MTVLAITPVRGGSKGIPGKNIKEIAGKPLLAWTIEAAKNSKLIDRYVVSTEDAAIANVARDYGAEVLDRPAELATDEATTLAVLEHAISVIPCDVVVLLQATSPVRGESLIDECITEFMENKYDSLATGFICKYVEYGKCDQRRQEIDGFFHDDGNIYVVRADTLIKDGFYGKEVGKKVVSRSENVDIDDDFDLWLAEKILREGIR